jgi:drug/metabolite transporter (DMT)-like permease
VLGVLVLNENVTATMLAGIALVLAGIALTRQRTKQASEALEDTGAPRAPS